MRTQWQQTLVSWQALSSPELGPLVARRSQREIDFWPTRERLLRQALAKAPQTLWPTWSAWARPPKAFRRSSNCSPRPQGPALAPATCHYAGLIAQGIAAEARALNTGSGAAGPERLERIAR